MVVESLEFDAFQAGCITFAFNSAAYISESLRGGIMAVDVGQREAAMALGVPYGKMMKDIIFPQAVKSVMPSLVNEFILSLIHICLPPRGAPSPPGPTST